MHVPIIAPHTLFQELPAFDSTLSAIQFARSQASQIIRGIDNRLLVIVGPCSIHDPKAAYEYGALLKEAAARFAEDLFIIMRVYFEKPRTTLGWKGLISDPHLDGTFDVNHGLRLSRRLLLDLAALGVPAATEFLDTITPQYLSDLISWGAIGARTSESQIHRELASGLPIPIGFKNTTDGNIQIAIDAIQTAKNPHGYLSIHPNGTPSVIKTTGNQNCHIILRGSRTESNYSSKHVNHAKQLLRQAGLTPRFMIDSSHGNSQKNYLFQKEVVETIASQIQQNSNAILGIMMESNLIGGSQAHHNIASLRYGQSITDGCMSWEDTLPLLERLALASKKRCRNIKNQLEPFF